MVSYIEDYGVTFRSTCGQCGVLLCTLDHPIRGTRGDVVPANATYTPGRPTLFCKSCLEVRPEKNLTYHDIEKLRGGTP